MKRVAIAVLGASVLALTFADPSSSRTEVNPGWCSLVPDECGVNGTGGGVQRETNRPISFVPLNEFGTNLEQIEVPGVRPDVVEALECERLKAQERERDRVAQEIHEILVALDPTLEHSTFAVEVTGELRILTPVTGSNSQIDLTPLYRQMDQLGVNDSHIRIAIHTHPSTPGNTGDTLRDETFINGFPSVNDYNSASDYSDNAVAIGRADRNEFENQFAYYIIDANGVLRQFEVFNPDGTRRPAIIEVEDGPDRVYVPPVGSEDRQQLQDALDDAERDAKGENTNEKCG